MERKIESAEIDLNIQRKFIYLKSSISSYRRKDRLFNKLHKHNWIVIFV